MKTTVFGRASGINTSPSPACKTELRACTHTGPGLPSYYCWHQAGTGTPVHVVHVKYSKNMTTDVD